MIQKNNRPAQAVATPPQVKSCPRSILRMDPARCGLGVTNRGAVVRSAGRGRSAGMPPRSWKRGHVADFISFTLKSTAPIEAPINGRPRPAVGRGTAGIAGHAGDDHPDQRSRHHRPGRLGDATRGDPSVNDGADVNADVVASGAYGTDDTIDFAIPGPGVQSIGVTGDGACRTSSRR